jgi:hypothetical protein
MAKINEGRNKALGVSQKRHYVCGFCGCEWDAVANFSGDNKKNKISNQTSCPRCTNFVPTWRKVKLPDGSHYHEGR